MNFLVRHVYSQVQNPGKESKAFQSLVQETNPQIGTHEMIPDHLGLHVKAIQFEIQPRNPELNTQKMVDLIRAHGAAADLLVFAEMAVPGYFIGDDWERVAFLERCEKCHELIRAASQDLTVVFGSVGIDRRFKGEDGRVRLYNAAHVFQNGKLLRAEHLDLDFWPKTLMANYREFEDSRHFYDLRKWTQDQGLPRSAWFQPFKICKPFSAQQHPEKQYPGRGAKKSMRQEYAVGLTICEDAWSDDYSVSPLAALREIASAQQLDLVLNLSASPYTKGKAQKRERVFSKRFNEVQTPILYVNALGVQNNAKNIFVFDGGSALFDAGGTTKATSFAEDVLQIVLGPGEQCAVRRKSEPLASGNGASRSQSEAKETADALLYALDKTLSQWQIKKVVIGASGGIDSSLNAALFTWVLGPEAVTLVNMPTRYNSRSTQDAARELAKNLGTKFWVFPIEKGLLETSELLFGEGELAELKSDLVMQNMQARERGARILAAIAAAQGAVFSCNANKSELTVGYSTLYGDAAGFLAPIGDLWKHEVYALAELMNSEYFKRNVIPKACFDLPPSAELTDSQNVDEGKGDPFLYPYHDKLFRLWVEGWHRADLEETLEFFAQGTLHQKLGVGSQLIASLFPNGAAFVADTERWWGLYTGLAAFKRVQTPPIVTLSPRSFGFDHKECLGPASNSATYHEVRLKVEKLSAYLGSG